MAPLHFVADLIYKFYSGNAKIALYPPLQQTGAVELLQHLIMGHMLQLLSFGFAGSFLVYLEQFFVKKII